ncbi:MAG: hypothetical protein RL660_1074 [Bacteroidota bacterium]|jgi:pyridoxamine 5'-phosphate oxidase
MMQRSDIADLRLAYKQSTLLEQDVLANPIAQFTKWFDEALGAQVVEANAMTLCTVDEQGAPHARIVLLKDITDGGFSFFTNYNSTKGHNIAANNKVSLVFFWKELERQVRIDGIATKLSAEVNEAYFRSRPLGSQIGAIASEQSNVLATRNELEERYNALLAKYATTEVPMPSHWGGYNVQPTTIEFWQGRDNRLHDRLQYNKQNDAWHIQRLNP